ncbi:possible neuromedin U precursor [Vibrio ishigakensis]|uniref:Possible neuromedin U n=1 Tax=Vibrio ishigakensis TaxID=1481914 RepID=A0A0B8P3L9_9VIBR|nr:hypothetical protein [Vibrio ishigakensis]GAM57584.1 possible neuromedin U precursor [Vibrio ishigakensis]
MNKILRKTTTAIALLASLIALPTMADQEQMDKKALADKAAKELANPNTALASLNFKFQYYGGYDDGGSSSTVLFQPSMPFPLDNGDKILFRPAIPFSMNYDKAGEYGDDSGFGDISFDLAYAPKTEAGSIMAFGVFAQLPTGQEGFTADQFAVGPEMLLGKLSKERIFIFFPNHLWGVSNQSDNPNAKDINRTSVQIGWVELLGNGWTVASSPTLSYDWNEDQAEIPLNFQVSKTVILGNRPWKFGLEANYYIEKDERTRPDFMIGLNITPVVENKLAGLF